MAAPPAGLFDSLRRLLGTTVELAQLRLELLSSDLQLEKLRLIGGTLRALVGLLLLGVGLLLAVGFVLLLVGEPHRLLAVGVLALLFVAGGLGLLYAAQRHLSSGEPLLAATTAELARDRDALEPRE